MTDSRKVQLTSEVDATGAARGLGEIETAAQRMAQGVQASGQKAAAGLDPIGNAGAGAGEKIDRTTKSIIASIERTTAAMKAGERNTASYFEALANQRGANTDALKPYLDQLRQAEQAQRVATTSLDKMGVSAGQTKAALRQLPAQFTDIFTSLQGGQQPLTVLIQQGGQIKDSFGGIGPALRGIAGAISPTVVALGGLAVAVGATALAYKAGSAEADAYRRALVLSGNFAGTTASQLDAVAKAVGGVVGGQGKAAEVLAQLAASGRIGAESFGAMATAAIRLERVGGPAAKATVDAFAELGKDPLKASIKLNESTNFLTVSLYKQIKALDEQGKTVEAARLAQNAYAKTADERSKDLERSLGVIERGWLAIADATIKAKNAALGIGRGNTPQGALEDARKARDAILKSTGGKDPAEGTFSAGQLRVANERIALLAEQIKQENAAAQAERDRAAAVKGGIAADEAAAKSHKKLDDTLQASRDAAKEWADAYLDGVKMQGEAEAATLGLTKAQARLVQYLSSTAYSQHTEEMRRLAVASLVAAHNAELQAQAEKDRQKAMADADATFQRYLQGLDKSIEGADREVESLNEQIAAIALGKDAREALIQARLDDAAAQAAQAAQAAYLAGNEGAEFTRLTQLADKLSEVAAKRRELAGATAAKEVSELNAKAAKDAAQDWERATESIRSDLTDAFRRAFESGEDFGTAMAKVIGNELKARLASAMAGLMADGVLSLAGLAINGQGGSSGQGAGALSTVNSLATVYSAGAKAYSWATGGTAATGLSADFIAGYKGATLAAGQAGPTTAGATGAMGAGSSAGSSAAWLSTWGAAIALGVYKANQDYSNGFRRDQAREVSQSPFFGGGVFGDLNPMGGMESTKADLLSKLGFSDRLADLLSGSTAVAALLGYSSPQIRNAGITGSITGGDFSGNATAEAVQKAGFVRKLFGSSDKVTPLTTDLPDEIGRFLDAGAAGILAKAKDYGTALGLPVDQLGSIAQAISLKADENGKITEEALITALAGYGDALVAGYAEAVKPLALVGETSAQTLARVGQSILDVNNVLGVLGLTAVQASVDGGKAAVSLEELFGGVATLQQAAGSYLQAYYTDAERAALATKNIAATLADFGLAVPATRDAFRGLVESQDLTTQSGREAFAVLMSVSDAFAQITPAARSAADILAERSALETELLQLQGNTAALRQRELAALDPTNRALKELIFAQTDAAAATDRAREAAEAAADAQREMVAAQKELAGAFQAAVGGAAGGVRSAYDAVRQMVNGERQAVESAAEERRRAAQAETDQTVRELEQQAQAVQQTFGSLLDGMKSALGNLDALLSVDGGRGSAMDTLRKGLAALRNGQAVNVDDLRAAAGTASRVSTDRFSSRADYQREVAATATLLRNISGAARLQRNDELTSIARRQVEAEAAGAAKLEAIGLTQAQQLAVLDLQLSEARAAVGSLVDIDDGVQNLADAMGLLRNSVDALRILNGGGGPTGQITQSGDTLAYRGAGGAVATRPVGGGWADTIVRGRSGAMATGDVLREAVLGLVANDDWARIVQVATAEGIDSAMLDGLMDWKPGSALAAALAHGLPAFAMGSAYVPSTGLALVHEGERVLTRSENASVMQMLQASSGGLRDTAVLPALRAVCDELRALRDDLQGSLTAVASNTRRTAETVETWEAVGMPPTVPA